jgi:hypothetical protein
MGMRILNNRKGVTLLIVLVLSAVALVISAGLLYMITTGTKMSGSTKRYRTACEAAHAGVDVMTQFVNTRGDASAANLLIGTGGPFSGLSFVYADGTGVRLKTKVANPSSSASWAGYDTQTRIDTINLTPNNTYDAQFDLGTNPTYRVYAKITSTAQGNSSGAVSTLHSGGATDARTQGAKSSGGSSEINAQSYPYLYSIEILAQKVTAAGQDPGEKCKLAVLYQY